MARKFRAQYPGAIYHVLTLSWIAKRLAMGAAGYAAQCLRQAEKD